MTVRWGRAERAHEKYPVQKWGIHPPYPPGSAMPCTKSITWNGGGVGEPLGSPI